MSWRIAVEARHAHPPQRVLDQVAAHLGIVLVQVGQDVDEPPVQGVALQSRARRGDPRGSRSARYWPRWLFSRAVEPDRALEDRRPRRDTGPVWFATWSWITFIPRRWAVVHQLPERGQVAEVLVDRVEVHGPVAMVVGDRRAVVPFALVQVIAVVVDGRRPDRGDSEVLQVGQALDQAPQVSAVVDSGVGRDRGARELGGVVVGGIPVREAVRHEEVEDVVVREALEAPLREPGARHDLESRPRPSPPEW